MLINSIILENFRGYSSRQVIDLSNFTAFVGRNDVGKSTILEALDIFFNEGLGPIKLDSSDVNIEARNNSNGSNIDIIIGVTFKDLPETVILDENNTTTLNEEYLLDSNQHLTILKRYPNGGKPKVFIYAYHPSNNNCNDLLSKKQADLRKLTEGYDCDRNKNAEMRKAIRNANIGNLNLMMQEIDVSKEDAKNIWEKLKEYMPVYSLFQADRSNGDKDREVQDPLKEAVKKIMMSEEIKAQCQRIYELVMNELDEVSNRTLQKISEMNPNLASTLHPTMPAVSDLKWTDVFKNVSITGDNDIPINKRGSGVKRLVLLNFFRAEAERTQQNSNAPGIIYAIEEPETSQHVDHQLLLISSLISLSQAPNTQVLITTHSSNILKALTVPNIRLIRDTNNGKAVEMVANSLFPSPSLNEIAFTAFGETTEEYHNELYSFIEYNSWKNDYDNGRAKVNYIKLKNGQPIQQQITMTEYIRHQIHHADNTLNPRYSAHDLSQSINDMRSFIEGKIQNP